MKPLWLAILLGFTALSALAQNDASPVLFKVDDERVRLDEFNYVYQKNNSADSGYTETDIRAYLDLYIQFKLKVHEARAQGLDTTAAFRKEFTTYRKQLAEPYLRDQEATEALVREAYQRMQEEVRAKHILIRVGEKAPPKDTLQAYRKIDSIRQAIEQGADFEEMALKHSQDPSVEKNKGDLGYFTAFQMIYPFESAVYALEEGEVSEPVRTRFGYHIIKLTDRRPNQGRVTVAHLMIRPQSSSEAEANEDEARQLIDSLYRAWDKGADFDELVRKYSEDRGSASAGGKIRPFSASSSSIPENFRETAFALDSGEVSPPIETPYGYHLIKLLEREPVGDFDDMRDEIRKKVKNDRRSAKSKQSAVRKFKRENDFTEKGHLEGFFAYVDSSLLNGRYEAPEHFHKQWLFFKRDDNQSLFTLGEEAYRYSDFARYLEQKQQAQPNQNLRSVVKEYYQAFQEKSVMQYQREHLSEKEPEYARLMREYEEGILLYEIMNQEVWNKAALDTQGQKAYYRQHRSDFSTAHQRLDASLFLCNNQGAKNTLLRTLRKSPESSTPGGDSLVATLEMEGTVKKGAVNHFRDTLAMGHSVYYPDTVAPTDRLVDLGKVDQKNVVLQVHEVLPPGPRPLDQVRGKVISRYQEQLEKQWLESLREKYTVSVNEQVLQQAISQLSSRR